MNLTDYAWAAGFLDGEGSVSIIRHKPRCGVIKTGKRAGKVRRDPMTYQLIVSAVQINPDPIDRLVSLFAGVKSRVHRTGGKGDYWRWRISSNQALAALELMLPFFVGKTDVVRLAVGFQRYWSMSKSPTRVMAPERRAFAEHNWRECRRLNERYRYLKKSLLDSAEGRVLGWPASAETEQAATGSGG